MCVNTPVDGAFVQMPAGILFGKKRSKENNDNFTE